MRCGLASRVLSRIHAVKNASDKRRGAKNAEKRRVFHPPQGSLNGWCDESRVRVGVFRSRRRKEADSLDGRPCPPPYVGGYTSLFTRRLLYSHPDLITPLNGVHKTSVFTLRFSAPSASLRLLGLVSTIWIRLRACLKMHCGVKIDSDGVRPSSGAATWHCGSHWRNRVRLLIEHCCGRGRPHSERRIFTQALMSAD